MQEIGQEDSDSSYESLPYQTLRTVKDALMNSEKKKKKMKNYDYEVFRPIKRKRKDKT